MTTKVTHYISPFHEYCEVMIIQAISITCCEVMIVRAISMLFTYCEVMVVRVTTVHSCTFNALPSALPFILLILSVLPFLCSNAVTTRRDKSILYSRSLITILVCCLVISSSNIYLNFTDKGIGLFHGLFSSTAINHTFHIFIFLICGLILQLNSFYPRKVWTPNFSSIYKLIVCKLVYFNSFILNKMAEQFRILEYPLIISFIVIGGVFLVSCSDLISIFLAIELQSYGLYILCSIYRDSEKATSAGLTYFLLGGLSSCFILLASSLLYGGSGDTSFDGIYIINNISNTAISAKDTLEPFSRIMIQITLYKLLLCVYVCRVFI